MTKARRQSLAAVCVALLFAGLTACGGSSNPVT
jgi:hypothetical protein